MDNIDKTQEFSLEDIMREFGSGDLPEPKQTTEQETKVLPDLSVMVQEPEETEESAPDEEAGEEEVRTSSVTEDTIRLDDLSQIIEAAAAAQGAQPLEEEPEEEPDEEE